MIKEKYIFVILEFSYVILVNLNTLWIVRTFPLGDKMIAVECCNIVSCSTEEESSNVSSKDIKLTYLLSMQDIKMIEYA